MEYLKLKNNRVPAEITYEEDYIDLNFKFNDAIKDEIKIAMEKARWNPENKSWRVANSPRSNFILDMLLGKDVYERFDKEIVPFEPRRGRKKSGGVLMDHQCDMAAHWLTRNYSIEAAEMGTGKTLMSIEALEHLQNKYNSLSCWYVAPKVALLSVKMEYKKWASQAHPNFFTIHQFVQQVAALDKTTSVPPRILILDEASKFRNPQAKCSQAAKFCADFIREYWGDNGYVLLMSGSPAPKSPLDWWMLCEIAYPGFIREGHPAKFLERVALVKKVAGESGVAYPKILTYKDSEKKCNVCGRLAEHPVHAATMEQRMTYVAGQEPENQPHHFISMTNEVKNLYKRMDGLVKVTLKKDCMELPEKVYRVIKLAPTKQIKQLAKVLIKTAGTAANALLLARELSDGFQYTNKLIGATPCQNCVDKTTGKPTGKTFRFDQDENGLDVPVEEPCHHCAGKRELPEYEVQTVECETPKEQALSDLLDEMEEDGRIVIFGAFQGTIDRICKTVVKSNWKLIRRDGRGWYSDLPTNKPDEMIEMFQRDKECPHERIALVGHPKSCGMGLTLTASDTILYFSNSFDAEDRIQSEDRLHRNGCRGCNILDFEHLPVDRLVRENLRVKRDLQSVTMGEVIKAMEEDDDD